MTRAARYVGLMILLAAACPPTAWGNLPSATAPSGEEDANRDQSTAVTRLTVTVRQADGQAANGTSGTAGDVGAAQAVDRLRLDLLMKRTADPRLEMPAESRAQMAALEAFGKLSIEEQKMVVPELLELLHNRSPIQGSRTPRDGEALEIRHRANLALSKVAKVYFGQFPVRTADASIPDDQAAGQAADELVARWTAWWAQASPLEEGERVALSKRLRAGNYEETDEAGFWINVGYAAAQKDATPTMLVARRLSEADRRSSPDADIDRLIPLLGQLCALPDAPPEGLLTLLNLVTDSSPVELRPGWDTQRSWQRLQVAGNVLQNVLQVGGNWLGNRVVQQDDQEGRPAYQEFFVHPEAIEAWEAAILQRVAEQFDANRSNDPDDPDVPAAQRDPVP